MISGTEPAADQLQNCCSAMRSRSSDDISVTVLRILCDTPAVVHAAVRGIADCSSLQRYTVVHMLELSMQRFQKHPHSLGRKTATLYEMEADSTRQHLDK